VYWAAPPGPCAHSARRNKQGNAPLALPSVRRRRPRQTWTAQSRWGSSSRTACGRCKHKRCQYCLGLGNGERFGSGKHTRGVPRIGGKRERLLKQRLGMEANLPHDQAALRLSHPVRHGGPTPITSAPLFLTGGLLTQGPYLKQKAASSLGASTKPPSSLSEYLRPYGPTIVAAKSLEAIHQEQFLHTSNSKHTLSSLTVIANCNMSMHRRHVRSIDRK
jgi:hypothetical protein